VRLASSPWTCSPSSIEILHPVGCDAVLCVLKLYIAGLDLHGQVIFDFVFLFEIGPLRSRLTVHIAAKCCP
jgi:hypothetical protein